MQGVVNATGAREEALAAQNLAFSLRQELNDRLDALKKQLEGREIDGRAFGRASSALFDDVFRTLAKHFLGNWSDKVALIAIGGDGRRQRAPKSDFDFMLLGQPAFIDQLKPDNDCPEAEAEAYTLFSRALTDVWPISSYIAPFTIEQSLERMGKDFELYNQNTASSVLDARFVWGNPGFLQNLKLARTEYFQANALSFVNVTIAKLQEGSIQTIPKPNIKSNLRYPQAFRWCLRASGISWTQLLSRDEMRQLKKAEDFLLNLRPHLHYCHPEHATKADFIEPEYLPRLAQCMGYSGTVQQSVEAFLKDYYKHTRNARCLVTRALESVAEKLLPQTERPVWSSLPEESLFERSGDKIRFADEKAPENGAAILQMFQTAQQESLTLHHSARRAISDNLSLLDGLEESPLLFMEILQRPDAAKTLTAMRKLGVLQKVLPVFAEIDGMKPYDCYNALPVDTHLIAALANLEAFASAQEGGDLWQEAPLSCRLIQNMDESRRKILNFAALLHDSCKGRKGGEHGRLAADFAREICPSFGFTQEETELVAWLTENHLLLARTAQRRLLSDPGTYRNLRQEGIVGDNAQVKLDMLTVLTAADTRAIGPHKWTKLLKNRVERLYWHMSEGSCAPVASALPPDYQPGSISVQVTEDSESDTAKIVLAAPDFKELLKGVAQTVHGLECDIVRFLTETVKVEERDTAVLTLDVQWVKSDGTRLMPFESRQKSLQDNLAKYLEYQGQNAGNIPDHQQDFDRVRPQIDAYSHRPLVKLFNNASESHTVVEMIAPNFPGLLEVFTEAIHNAGGYIVNGLSANYGQGKTGKATDVFYIVSVETEQKFTDKACRKLTEHIQQTLEQRLGQSFASNVVGFPKLATA